MDLLTRIDAVFGEGSVVAGYAAAEIMRGPLVVAKRRLAGTSRVETFDFKTITKRT